MKNRRIDLDQFDKAIIIIWAILIALLLGAIEAQAFAYYLDYELHNFPFYWLVYTLFIFLMLSIVPFLTREKTDWLLTIGGAFLIQFFQDIGHWLTKMVIQGTWNLGDPLWTPLWDLLSIDFPIPLFWIIDLFIFGIFFIVWWILDRYLAVAR